jgi:hypothetical protein
MSFSSSLSFSSTKPVNRRAEQVPPGGERVGTSERRKEVGKRWRVNILQILCTHVCKWRNDIY